METVQTVNIKVQPRHGNQLTRLAGWSALAVFAGWILAFVGAVLTSSAFPGEPINLSRQ